MPIDLLKDQRTLQKRGQKRMLRAGKWVWNAGFWTWHRWYTQFTAVMITCTRSEHNQASEHCSTYWGGTLEPHPWGEATVNDWGRVTLFRRHGHWFVAHTCGDGLTLMCTEAALTDFKGIINNKNRRGHEIGRLAGSGNKRSWKEVVVDGYDENTLYKHETYEIFKEQTLKPVTISATLWL